MRTPSHPCINNKKEREREREEEEEEEESMHQTIWKIMLQERKIIDSSNWQKRWSPISYA